MTSFLKELREAIKFFLEHGYSSEESLIMWTERLRNATEEKIGGSDFYQYVSRRLTAAYSLEVGRERALKRHPGISRFTLHYVEPKLRAELDRRIMASADLIKLNRTQAINRTIQRFSGWATSVPPINSISLGLSASSRSGVLSTSQHIAKSARQIDFEQRRVMVDQTHKLIANIDNIIATEGGAIAAVWHSHWRQADYDYREPHKERDLKVYAIRGNWAVKKGFMRTGPEGYLDEITQPGEEVFCFPGDTLIPFSNNVEVAYRRWYSGKLAVISTDSGKTLRATLNHPILTFRGWIPAGDIKEGDQVIEIADQSINPIMSEVNDNRAVPSISEIFETLLVEGDISGVSGSRHQFHGDGSDGYVDVIRATSPLRFGVNPGIAQGIKEIDLTTANNFISCHGALEPFFIGRFLFAPGYMRRLCSSAALFWRFVLGDKGVGFNLVTESSASRNDFIANDFPADHELFGELENTLSGFVTPPKFNSVETVNSGVTRAGAKLKKSALFEGGARDVIEICDLLNAHSSGAHIGNVSQVGRVNFSGHVYNLQTDKGWYSAGGIVTHNCRCYLTYIYNVRSLPDEMKTDKWRKFTESNVSVGRRTIEGIHTGG